MSETATFVEKVWTKEQILSAFPFLAFSGYSAGWEMLDKEDGHKVTEANMATLREEAKAFEPQTTKNVADLEKLNLDMDIQDRKGVDKEGKEFAYKVVVVDGQEYRIPNSVINSIKTILEAKPTQQTVKVIKKGSGMSTEYTVIQVD